METFTTDTTQVEQFAYDAIAGDNRRRAPKSRPQRESKILSEKGRRKLTATTQDLRRNYTIAAWAIRKHLDYVSSFTLQVNTGDKTLDDSIEKLMRWWGKRKNCDAAQRHPLRRMIRLAEAHRTVDGDFGF